jgi:hypothetical protein
MNIKTAKGFDSNKSAYAKMAQQVLQGFESIPAAYSSPPELRNPVGKDQNLSSKQRAELSDRELEQ